MSTIGSLLALASDPQIKPWDEIVKSSTQAQTGLRELADLKRKQASEALLMERIQHDPELRQRLFGDGSILGSLQTAPGGPGGGPGAGPMTQQSFAPGQDPGAPQVVPGGQDLSRFANVPPQGGGPIPPDVMAQTMPTMTPPGGVPTLATLGPQGGMAGPGPQPQRNPLMEMAARDPRAALMLQQQLQTRQEQQWKTEQRRLDMGVKIAEAVAQELNGVRDQPSLDAARARVQQYHPQAAAQIPQFYSKDALEPLIMKGVAIKDLALWRKNEATARQTEMMTQQLPATFRALEQFATGGTPQAPAGDGAPAPATTTGTQARTAPPEFESAITEANRLYPQVSTTRIKSIIAAESNFDPKAVSSAGAQGPMQLMPGTAKNMGVDDPFNVQQNVRGGTRYYAQLLTQYGGDERKALTAYNWGPGNLDKVGGDVSKAPPETQAYVTRVLGGGGAGGTTQAPATDPRIAGIETRIKQGQALALKLSATPGMEQAATMVNQQVNDLQKDRDRLVDRSTEISRAVDQETALQPLKIAQQRAGAEVQREAKQYEPIGTTAADELDLPASTLWKDVPKDRKPMPRPEKGERDALSGLRASVAGVDSLLTKLDDPTIARMIGTIFTEPPAAVNRLLGPWLATLPPAQRAFAATMAGEIMEIRHRLIGAGQTGIEVAALEPMMPSPADTDPATVRAKLTALREGMLRRHNAKRDDLAGLGYRVPDKLAAPPPSPSGLTPAQQQLLDKHTTR